MQLNKAATSSKNLHAFAQNTHVDTGSSIRLQQVESNNLDVFFNEAVASSSNQLNRAVTTICLLCVGDEGIMAMEEVLCATKAMTSLVLPHT